jgi:hypothetical protein
MKWAVVETEVSPSNFIFCGEKHRLLPPSSARRQKMKFERLTFARERGELETIDGAVWRALGTVAGGEVVPSL